MKHLKTLGLCLVAVLALGAGAGASAASAEAPAFKACVKAEKVGKTYIGKYTSKECTAASEVGTGGKYERVKVTPKTPFTSKSKAATFAIAGKVVKCKKDTDAGELLSGGVAKVTIEFAVCGINGSTKAPCTTEGSATGTIKTFLLLAEPRWVNPEETETGLVLFNASNKFAEFNCGAEKVILRGGLTGSTVNTKKGITISFKVVGGVQEHEAFYEEGEEEVAEGEIPFHLFTNPGEVEATLETADEQGPKGVGIF